MSLYFLLSGTSLIDYLEIIDHLLVSPRTYNKATPHSTINTFTIHQNEVFCTFLILLHLVFSSSISHSSPPRSSKEIQNCQGQLRTTSQGGRVACSLESRHLSTARYEYVDIKDRLGIRVVKKSRFSYKPKWCQLARI